MNLKLKCKREKDKKDKKKMKEDIESYLHKPGEGKTFLCMAKSPQGKCRHCDS